MSMMLTDEDLVFHRRRRQAWQSLVLDTASCLLLAFVWVLIIGSGPIDYRASIWLAGGTTVLMAVLGLPVFAIRLLGSHRVSVVLSPHGISQLPHGKRLPWSDIKAIGVGWRLAGRHVVVTRHTGRPVRLFAPTGSPWWPDPTFHTETQALTRWAARYSNAATPEPRPPRAATPKPVAMVVLAVVLALVTVRAMQRGVIWPWTVTASRAAAACPALAAAGLDRFWPADTRTLQRDDRNEYPFGDYSYCSWKARPDTAETAPYEWIYAVVRRHGPAGFNSPVAMAINSYRHDRASTSRAGAMPGLGDEAFLAKINNQVTITARRANITVSVEVTADFRHQSAAEMTARSLVTAILASIRLDE
jgi:hypothetical protein